MNDATRAKADVKLQIALKEGKVNKSFSDYMVQARTEASAVNYKRISYFSTHCSTSFMLII